MQQTSFSVSQDIVYPCLGNVMDLRIAWMGVMKVELHVQVTTFCKFKIYHDICVHTYILGQRGLIS